MNARAVCRSRHLSLVAGGGGAQSALAAVAAEALACAPSLIQLDDLDRLCPAAAVGSCIGMGRNAVWLSIHPWSA
jgi:hypothetical protein